MKAQAQTESLLNQSNQPLCESTLTSSGLRSLLLARGLFTLVRKKTSGLLHLQKTFVHAVREALVGLNALLLSLESEINRRICVGLGLMGVVAPLAACGYMLFDWRVDKVQGWYHDNYFHFFLVIAPYLFVLLCLIGVWYLFPAGSKRAYALAVPSGFTIGKILWLALVNNDAEFYSVVPLSFVLMGAFISAFLFTVLDWFAHNKFHREDAYEARLSKLMDMADDFDDAKFKSMVKTVWREKRAFQKQF